jgi:hypothetical protein
MDENLKITFDQLLSSVPTDDISSNIKAYLEDHKEHKKDMFHYLIILELFELLNNVFNVSEMLKVIPTCYQFVYRYMSLSVFISLFKNQTNIFEFFREYDDLNFQIVKYLCDNRNADQQIPLKFFKVIAENDAKYFIEHIGDELSNFCNSYINSIFIPRNNESIELLKFYKLGYKYAPNL